MNVPGANCEIDDLTFLSSLNALIDSNCESDPQESDGTFVDTHDYSDLIAAANARDTQAATIRTKLANHSVVYVSGYIAKRLLKNLDCSTCRDSYRTDQITDQHAFIRFKDYDPEMPRLVLPTHELANSVDLAKKIFENYIRPTLHVANIRKRTYGLLKQYGDFSWMCPDHSDQQLLQFCKLFCKIIIHSECKHINRGGMWRHLSASNAKQMSRFLRRGVVNNPRQQPVKRSLLFSANHAQ